MAYHGALTGLPNRRQLMEGLSLALAQARLHQTYGGLLFIDLDKFKALNDTLGHDAGDRLLIQVACRLRECVREVDTVARLGGDEFIAYSPPDLRQIHFPGAAGKTQPQDSMCAESALHPQQCALPHHA